MPGGGIPIGAPRPGPGGIPIGGPIGGRMPGGGPIIPAGEELLVTSLPDCAGTELKPERPGSDPEETQKKLNQKQKEHVHRWIRLLIQSRQSCSSSRN